jgi:uncharacterized membrane protein
VLWIAVIAVVVMTLVTLLAPANPGQRVVGVPPILHPLEPLAAKLNGLLVVLPILFLISAASLVVRARRASSEDRTKLKWIAYGALIAVLYFALAFAVSLAFDHPGNPLQPLASVLQSGVFFALAVVPTKVVDR